MLRSDDPTSKLNPEENIEEIIKNIVGEENRFKNTYIPVFVSSPKVGLEEERNAVNLLLKEMGLDPKAMEFFGAKPEPPLETCLNVLNTAKLFVLILGMRYGCSYSCDEGKYRSYNGKSYTEIEYDAAVKKEMRVLAYCIDEDHAKILPIYVDRGDDAKKLDEFKNKVKKNHTIYPFKDTTNLVYHVCQDVTEQVNILLDPTVKQSNNQGNITIISDKSSIYYTESVIFQGTSTKLEPSYVYLYLLNNKMQLSAFPYPKAELLPLTQSGDYSLKIPVLKDGTWRVAVDPSQIKGLDTGKYTFLVSSYPMQDKEIEASNGYDTCTVSVKKPYLSATSNFHELVLGGHTYVRGTAITKQGRLTFWLCTKDTLVTQFFVDVYEDNTYVYVFPYDLIKTLTPDIMYFLIIQMSIIRSGDTVQLSRFDSDEWKIGLRHEDGSFTPSIFLDKDKNTTVNFPEELCHLIDNKTEHDIYVKLVFYCRKPFFELNQPTIFDGTLRLSGVTNHAPGATVLFELVSKDENTSFISRVTTKPRVNVILKDEFNIIAGCDQVNIFELNISTSRLTKGKYEMRFTLESTAQRLLTQNIDINHPKC
ncbi:hypothetical protein SDC9_35835 [bioreactor metagenome]|uniref:DUF4062 domain-containing protein n=1 Tax=bioreactor metagenome TaxID=1076179 RepID=A0A644VGQ4_9ZZZZ|nr:DUF4062 domain-containing protein [Methanocorpusculum sp.]